MSKHDGLIERLRGYVSDGDDFGAGAKHPTTIAVRNDLDEAIAAIRELETEIGIWKGEAENRSQAMIDLNLDRAAQGVEILKLKESLEPFANFGEFLEIETEGFSDEDDLHLIVESGHLLERFKVAAFRHARAAMERKP